MIIVTNKKNKLRGTFLHKFEDQKGEKVAVMTSGGIVRVWDAEEIKMVKKSVQKFLEEKQLTMTQVAKNTDLSLSTVSRFIAGQRSSKKLMTYLIDIGCPRDSFDIANNRVK